MRLKTVLICFFSRLCVCFSQASELPSPFSKCYFRIEADPSNVSFPQVLLIPPNSAPLLVAKIIYR